MAAEQGHMDTQCNLDCACVNGEGVNKNKTSAMRWYRKAAQKGDADSQCHPGDCDYNCGVHQD